MEYFRAIIEKARSRLVFCLALGTANDLCSEDLGDLVGLCVGKRLDKEAGANPLRDLKTNRRIFRSIL